LFYWLVDLQSSSVGLYRIAGSH